MRIHSPARSRRAWGLAATSTVALAALMVGGLSGAAVAAQPKMSVDITPVTDTIQSGGSLVYRVAYQCSNITLNNCVAPTFTIPAPVGTAPDGSSVPITTEPTVNGNVDLVSATGAPVSVLLKDLAPGTTGEFSIAWTVPNFTTLPGTTFPATADLTFTDPSTGAPTNGGSALTPIPITTTAESNLTAVKQMVTPTTSADVTADAETTYRVYAANRGGSLGALDYTNLTLVDTLPAGTQFVSATGGGVYNAAAETVTWSVPAPARNNAAAPEQFFELTVRYPAGTFVPAPADPQAVNNFVNQLDASATAIDGTQLNAHDEREHALIGPPLTSGNANIVPYAQKGFDGPTVATSNTTTPYQWNTLVGWQDTANGGVADTNRLRTWSIIDRLSCLVDGRAVSPTVPADSSLGSYPGSLGVPADQCTNPAFDLQRINTTARLLTFLDQIDLVTWDGSTSRSYTWTPPTNFAGFLYTRAGLPGYNAAVDASLDLPAGEIVTDFRIVGKDLPAGGGMGEYIRYRGVSTPAFAATGLIDMTNTLTVNYSVDEYAPGQPLPTGTPTTYEHSALATFFPEQTDPQLRKTNITGNQNALTPGETTRWQLQLTNGANGNIPMRPKLIDILPVGLELDESSIGWLNLGDLPEPTLEITTVTIGGKERTKLTWMWPAGSELRFGDPRPTVRFNTTVTIAATEGAHTGEDAQLAGLFDDNVNSTNPNIGNATDIWDLDGDGNTDERIAQDSQGWTVIPTAGASIEKWVKGALDADWTKDGLTNATFDGSDSQIDYRLGITNPNNTNLTDLVVYDVLPVTGDTAIGEQLAGEERGSQWDPTFTSITSLPAGASVEYSTAENPCRPELFNGANGADLPAGCEDDWSATVPADASSVTAIKVTVPVVAPSVEPVFIEFRMQAPKLTGAKDLAVTNPEYVANNNVAWHSYRTTAAGGTESLPAAEAPLVSVRRAAGTVGDRVWLDSNRDGLQSDGEKGVEGITVELRDASGNPVLDADGNPIRTTTDENGEYSFTVPLGEWSVAFVDLPAEYEFTTPQVGDDDASDSDATAPGVPTHTVTITDPIRGGAGANVNLDLDAGLVKASVTITKDDGKTIVTPGEETTYTITVTNSSASAAAQDVIVTDALPEELEFVSASNGGVFDKDAQTVTWDLGTIAAGGSVSVTITAKVKDSVPADTEIVNIATVSGPCEEDCDATDIDNTPPKVTIEKDDHKTVVGLGEALTYDLVVRNLSDKTDATGVIVTDTLPEQLEFDSASDGGIYDENSHTVTWDLGDLPMGAERTVQVTAIVALPTPAGDTITNGARVDTDQGCVDADCEAVDIDHTPDITIVKDDHRELVAVGDELTYDVTVSNRSDWATTGVIVTDELPGNVDYVSASDNGRYDADTRTVTWNLGELAGNTSKTVQVTVTVKQNAAVPGTVVNNATVTTDQGCIGGPCTTTDIDKLVPPHLAHTGLDNGGILLFGGAGLALIGGLVLLMRRRQLTA